MAVPIPLNVKANADGNSYSCICCNREPRVIYVKTEPNSQEAPFKVEPTPRAIPIIGPPRAAIREQNREAWSEFQKKVTTSYPEAEFPRLVEEVTKRSLEHLVNRGRPLRGEHFNTIMELAHDVASSKRDDLAGQQSKEQTSDGGLSPFRAQSMSPRDQMETLPE